MSTWSGQLRSTPKRKRGADAVAGAAAHGLDRYRYRASGGFVHGFRFAVRALWRMLEERYEQQPLAARTFQWGSREHSGGFGTSLEELRSEWIWSDHCREQRPIAPGLNIVIRRLLAEMHGV